MIYLIGDTIVGIYELALVSRLPSRQHQPSRPTDNQLAPATVDLARIVATDVNPLTGFPRTMIVRSADPYHSACALGLIYLPLDDIAINPVIGPRFCAADPHFDSPSHPAFVSWGPPPLRYALLTPLSSIYDILRSHPPLVINTFDLTRSGHLIERPIPAAYFLQGWR